MKLAKEIGLIFLLAIFWFAPAYYAGEALLPGWGLQCGLVSLITGLIGLVLVNRTEAGRRLFYEGERGDEPFGCIHLLVLLLIGTPVTLLLLGTIWWIMRLMGLLGFK